MELQFFRIEQNELAVFKVVRSAAKQVENRFEHGKNTVSLNLGSKV